jgi:hypothetical protein
MSGKLLRALPDRPDGTANCGVGSSAATANVQFGAIGRVNRIIAWRTNASPSGPSKSIVKGRAEMSMKVVHV